MPSVGALLLSFPSAFAFAIPFKHRCSFVFHIIALLFVPEVSQHSSAMLFVGVRFHVVCEGKLRRTGGSEPH